MAELMIRGTVEVRRELRDVVLRLVETEEERSSCSVKELCPAMAAMASVAVLSASRLHKASEGM